MYPRQHYIVFLLCWSNILAAQQAPLVAQSITEHISDVNKHWQQQAPSELSNNSFTFSSDRDRIQLHFEQVYQLLKSNTTDHLSCTQKERRANHLELLKNYSRKGVFPTNAFHSHRQPYFVDDQETRCAVAHLVEESGENRLLNRIRKENNYGYITELLHEFPELQQWSYDNGFSPEELALIQPGYPAMTQHMYPVGNDGGCNGKINVLTTSQGGGWLLFAGDFTEIDGVQANSIIAWDGEDWINLGNGVEGEIFDLHYHDNKLHICGHFKLYGETEYSNIAYYNGGGEWVSMQTGGDGDIIYTMETFQNKLYIGGDFDELDFLPKSNLAFYNPDSMSWMNYGFAYSTITNSAYTVPNVFATDDVVYALKAFGNELLVGGRFKEVAPDMVDANIPPGDEIEYLGSWAGHAWNPPIEFSSFPFYDLEDLNAIRFIEQGEDRLLLGGILDEDSGYFIFENINGNMYINCSLGVMDTLAPLAIGHLNYEGYDYIFGNLRVYHTVIYGSTGLHQLNSIRDGRFNGPVTAAAVFQNNMYFAGTFTEVFEEPFNNLAYSAWNNQTVSTQSIPKEKKVTIYPSNKSLIIVTPAHPSICSLQLYSINGQLLQSFDLASGLEQQEVHLSDGAAGAYIWQWSDGVVVEGGVLVLP
jgi:hypothetical protein